MVTDPIRSYVVSVESEVTSRKLIIPHDLLVIDRALKSALPNWEIIVGAERLSDLGEHLKSVM